MAFVAQHIDHVEVFVNDLDASAKWYGQVLGLEETYRADPEPIFLTLGNTSLALFKGSGKAGPTDHAHWHRVAWRTDAPGFTAAQEHLRANGVKFGGPVDHGVAESIYFEDPDGNPLEITHYRS